MTKIYAHRGASGYAPENTLEAFKLAIKQGAEGIELDVQLTKDGEVVVIHDETIDRVSNKTGFVKDYTLAELREFSFDNNIEGYKNTKIPTLKEVLELLKPTNLMLNIELKTSIIWYENIEEKVLKLVYDTDMRDRVIYSSFNHYSIKKIKNLDEKANTALLFGDVILDTVNYIKNANIPAIHPPVYQLKMDNFLDEYINSGLDIRVWTVNNPDDMQSLINKNIDAIITNYPDIALKKRGELR
ncbi:MAG TPA: glycerophosphodiester phosphodiesterase [Candidatus Butyricicoccus avistercoris]|uniref:Glycerophosphodiester phosphodiesterase n=1 Tax=Candidatus Butyricicoccus avistercoris TaxID=2838518 RepID=A0A9D1TJ29_9FIRM|nr:glycerophosphodiester phosphodiesterase [Candidatus Butyricicoccus avistercoris]